MTTGNCSQPVGKVQHLTDPGEHISTSDSKSLYSSSFHMYSDAAGLGYILLMNDSPMLHAPSKFLDNQQSSYGLYFTISVSLPTTAGLKDTTLVM